MDSKKKEIINNYFEKHLTLFYDKVFREVVGTNKDFVEEILRVFLNDENLVLLESSVQKDMSIYNQKSVVLDCFCKLGNGDLANIEIEKNTFNDKCDHQKRVRYYSSMINVKSLSKGEKYDNLPNLYMIYLTKKDIFKKRKSVYHIERQIFETKDYLDNGYHEIYINAEIDDKSDISEMMKSLSRNDYLNKKFKVVSRIKEVRMDPNEMPKEVKEAFEEMRQENIAEGKKQTFILLFNQGVIGEDVVIKNLNITKDEFATLLKEQK